MTTTTYPDVLGDLRTWCRALPGLSSISGRVFFHIPTTTPTFPLVRLYLVGGGPDGNEAPVENIRVAFEIWGRPLRGGGATGPGTYGDITALMLAIKAGLHDLVGPIGTTTVVLNAEATNVLQSPDPDTGAPRFIVDALLTVHAA